MIDNICIEFRNDLICSKKELKNILIYLLIYFHCFEMIEEELKKKLESATFKRLVSHLQKNTDLQNIDLMNLAGFVEIVYLNGWLKKLKK